jgi:hypothetical protein
VTVATGAYRLTVSHHPSANGFKEQLGPLSAVGFVVDVRYSRYSLPSFQAPRVSYFAGPYLVQRIERR